MMEKGSKVNEKKEKILYWQKNFYNGSFSVSLLSMLQK